MVVYVCTFYILYALESPIDILVLLCIWLRQYFRDFVLLYNVKRFLQSPSEASGEENEND